MPADIEAMTRHPKAAGPGEPIRMHNPMCLGCGEDAPRGLHLVVRAGEDFTVETEMGRGTTVTMTKWLQEGTPHE